MNAKLLKSFTGRLKTLEALFLAGENREKGIAEKEAKSERTNW